MSNRKRSNGFTLIELLIVILIVAILSAIAFPAYDKFVQRTRRADGREMILRVSAAEDRYYTNRNSYSSSIAADLRIGSGESEKGYYMITAVVPADGQTFTLTATPQGIQASDPCANLIINSVGAKSFSGSETNGKCW